MEQLIAMRNAQAERALRNLLAAQQKALVDKCVATWVKACAK